MLGECRYIGQRSAGVMVRDADVLKDADPDVGEGGGGGAGDR